MFNRGFIIFDLTKGICSSNGATKIDFLLVTMSCFKKDEREVLSNRLGEDEKDFSIFDSSNFKFKIVVRRDGWVLSSFVES